MRLKGVNLRYMNNKEKNFCVECGSQLAYYFTGKYDAYTGEDLMGRYCVNLLCKEGCAHVGHVWGKAWKFQDWEKCQRCGRSMNDW